MKLKTPHMLALAGLAGLGLLAVTRPPQISMQAGSGDDYLVIAEGMGADDTDWQAVADALDRSPYINRVRVRGNGPMRAVTFALTPQGNITATPGKTLMQVHGVNILVARVHPGSSSEFGQYLLANKLQGPDVR